MGELSWGRCTSRHAIERRVDSVTSLLVIKMVWLLSGSPFEGHTKETKANFSSGNGIQWSLWLCNVEGTQATHHPASVWLVLWSCFLNTNHREALPVQLPWSSHQRSAEWFQGYFISISSWVLTAGICRMGCVCVCMYTCAHAHMCMRVRSMVTWVWPSAPHKLGVVVYASKPRAGERTGEESLRLVEQIV